MDRQLKQTALPCRLRGEHIGETFVRRAMQPALPDRFGHEWEPDGGSLMICRLCGELTGSMAARLACAGSAAEPGSLEGGDDGE